MDMLRFLAPFFQPYITINAIVPGRTYDYAKRKFYHWPLVNSVLHRPKVHDGEWLYVAIPADAKLTALGSGDRLYVGSQARSDRMFRGDGLDGANFHHAQMRAGNGDKNLIAYLAGGGKVRIHVVGRHDLARAVREVGPLAWLARLLDEPVGKGMHTGTRFENAILHLEAGLWAWHTKWADARVASMLKDMERAAVAAYRPRWLRDP